MDGNNQSVLLVLTGPSGVGKTTVGKNLLGKNDGLKRVVTCTTRAPREGEVDGKDYQFLSDEEFARRVEAGEFLEFAEVYGCSYGTMKSDVLEIMAAGDDVLVVIDVQGAMTFTEMARQDSELASVMTTIFLTAQSTAALRVRLNSRNEDSEEVIEKRVLAAEAEMALQGEFDHLVVSSTREADAQSVQVIYARSKKPNDG